MGLGALFVALTIESQKTYRFEWFGQRYSCQTSISEPPDLGDKRVLFPCEIQKDVCVEQQPLATLFRVQILDTNHTEGLGRGRTRI